MNNFYSLKGNTKMMKVGRFLLAAGALLAFGLSAGSNAMAWDFTLRGQNGSSGAGSSDGALARGAALSGQTVQSGFVQNQAVNLNFNGVIVAAHSTQTLPTINAYNPNVPIVNIEPVVTSGTRPLVVGGTSCTVTIYGVDAAGNLYDISSVAWMSLPSVVTWTGGTVIPNQPTNPNTILQIGVQTQPNNPGKAIGMSFTEQAPAVQANPATNIQVTATVIMDALLPNGAQQGWSFNDSVNTVAAGTIVPPAPPTYDLTLEIPGNPPYTMRLLNVPAASISAASN
jgi:hypothetical protein